MRLFARRRFRRTARSLFSAMEAELGPLIWPSDHTHEIDGSYRTDCPACKALYRCQPGCDCGHCLDWPGK